MSPPIGNGVDLHDAPETVDAVELEQAPVAPVAPVPPRPIPTRPTPVRPSRAVPQRPGAGGSRLLRGSGPGLTTSWPQILKDLKRTIYFTAAAIVILVILTFLIR
ncbi:MAG: hypothetical protein HY329_02970 [Chloroflexi bacterium]|nr:hypothetical protein [Chloroflexota bacterium]